MADAQSTVQSKDIIMRFALPSAPNDKFTMVCELDNQAAATVEVTETETKNCGTATGYGSPKHEYSGNTAFNYDPAATEVSYQQVWDWLNDGVLLNFELLNAEFTGSDGSTIDEGTILHQTGQGRFISVTLTTPVNGVGQFAWTFKPAGSVSNAQESPI